MKDNNIENLFQKSKTEKSPASLDNFILSQAKNSCDDKQVLNKPVKRNAWLFRLSTAAVVVLSFSIILNLQNENELITEPIEYMQNNSTPMKTNQSKKQPSKQSNQQSRKVRPTAKVVDDSMSLDVESNEFSEPYIETYDNSTEESPAPMPATAASDSVTEPTYEIQIEDKKNSYIKRTLEAEQLKPVTDDAISQRINASAVSGNLDRETKIDNVNYISDTENHESILKAPPVSQAKKEEISNQNGSEELERITVTGARMARDSSKETEQIEELSFTEQLEQLDNLIKDKKFEEAKQMLLQLQKSHTYYNFSKYKELLE